MIYTGYFAQLKKYQEAGLTPVSIARITPNWYEGYVLPELAPSKSLLYSYKAGQVTEEEYKEEYSVYLSLNVPWKQVLAKLRVYGQKQDVILLCYEKSKDFCHRHILAEYLRESGYEATEYKLPKMKTCNKGCETCKNLNTRVDAQGYPFGYECLKFGNTVEKSEFLSTKTFNTYE